MIYLIDDKPARQFAYGWTPERLNSFADIITPIYKYSHGEDNKLRNEIFAENNIILFHESFFDNQENLHLKESLDIRKSLVEYAQNQSSFLLAVFSGSKSSRVQDNNIIHLPVSTLYQNLQVFLSKVKQANVDFKYLLFGANPEIEEFLINELDAANATIDDLKHSDSKAKNLVLRPNKRYLQKPLQNYQEQTLYSKVDDADFSIKINEWLSNEEYDNIFIPLCFGSTLSDFNGLRFATHIRCTKSQNQLKNIFIYSFVDYSYLINNEYFDILKTKNVMLIDYKKAAFQKAAETQVEPLTLYDLPNEVAQLKLSLPKNYEDSHSISNEWAICRWAFAIGTSDDRIAKITIKVSNTLYYKYLNTIYPIKEIGKIEAKNLEISYKGSPKVLYIDDEADKGWYEILCTILGDINTITDVDYLCEELKSKSRQEIIDLSVEKIKSTTKYFDLVILDFRLHPDDFYENDIKQITGLRLLEEIKEINPGIQVIIFSATNKIWNYKLLSTADGFILKEAPENSVDPTFTYNALVELVKEINDKLKRVFLKSLFNNLKTISNSLYLIESINENPKFNRFIHFLRKQLVVIYDSLKNVILSKPDTIDVVFLCCYNFIEAFKKYYLRQGSDCRYYLGYDDIDLMRYDINNIEVSKGVPFVPQEHYEKPGIFHVYVGLLKDYFHISNEFDSNRYIIKCHSIRDLRNNYFHGDKKHFEVKELEIIIDLLLPLTNNIRE